MSHSMARPRPGGLLRHGLATRVPAGSDVSAGTYRCTRCGYTIRVGLTNTLPLCPSCRNDEYETVSGGGIQSRG